MNVAENICQEQEVGHSRCCAWQKKVRFWVKWSYKRYRQGQDNTVQCCVSGVPKLKALSVHAGLGGGGHR